VNNPFNQSIDWLYSQSFSGLAQFMAPSMVFPGTSQVESFNFQWLRKARARPAARPSGQQLCGLRHPGLFHSHRVRLALASIPRWGVTAGDQWGFTWAGKSQGDPKS